MVLGMALREGAPSAGTLLREWRQRRHLSQLELARRWQLTQPRVAG
jgi:transcriptional regulator with XRE-family HTH domain